MALDDVLRATWLLKVGAFCIVRDYLMTYCLDYMTTCERHSECH